MAKRKQTPETPLQKGMRLRLERQQALMTFIHRKPSTCGLDVESYVAEAKARLKREKTEKPEYTPPRPADWQTAFLTSKPVTITPAAVVTYNCKRVKAFKNDLRCWGKGGVKIINMIARGKKNKQMFDDAASYAR